jgi:hypothetical protein
MKNSEHDLFAEQKFRSFASQVLVLNLCLFSGIVGIVGLFIDPTLCSLYSLWSLWFILPVFPVMYGANELFKLMKLVIGGWFLCHDCRRPKAKRARCTRMKEGIMVDVCKSCLVHFENPSPLKSKVSPSFPLWSRGELVPPPKKPFVAKPPTLHV